MDAAADHLEEQLRSAFPDGVIARSRCCCTATIRRSSRDRAARAFFDWAGRLEGKQADPQTVHAFCVANGAALDKLSTELPSFIGWVEFRPDNPPGAAVPEGWSYRIVRHRKRAAPPDEASEKLTPVMAGSGLPICRPWTP
jgi:hypothetical protein